MSDTSLNEICGLAEIKEEVSKIKAHKLSYTIFNVSSIDPVGFQIVHSGGIEKSRDVRAVVSQENLNNIFASCKNNMDLDTSSFIVYDLGFYNKANNYREVVVLIYYISDNTPIRKKIIMASNVETIMNKLDVGILVKIQDPEDFSYDKIKENCISLHIR